MWLTGEDQAHSDSMGLAYGTIPISPTPAGTLTPASSSSNRRFVPTDPGPGATPMGMNFRASPGATGDGERGAGSGERGNTQARPASGEVERGNMAGPDGTDGDTALQIAIEDVDDDRDPSTLRNIDPDRTGPDATADPPPDIPDDPDSEGLMDIEIR